jgi:hypothetical protein
MPSNTSALVHRPEQPLAGSQSEFARWQGKP